MASLARGEEPTITLSDPISIAVISHQETKTPVVESVTLNLNDHVAKIKLQGVDGYIVIPQEVFDSVMSENLSTLLSALSKAAQSAQ